MVESHWDSIRGEELRYRDHTWELSGDVEIQKSGDLLAVDARQVDDVRRRDATLYFGLETPTDSLNPGNLGDYSVRFERTENGQYLVVKNEQRTYRYELRRLEYD